ncbi:MAG: 3'(2'),5'-bisphosphate nucleotidase CysQ [Rhodobiaceae bacterium]|nr:3'(2'),5'-bisphosphate nucleotidase CysQ [Rhodobiaceae bacterium]
MNMAPLTTGAMLDRLADIAVSAGQEILAVRERGVRAGIKADASPVTEADQAAEELILKSLAEVWPEIPVIAEEAASAGNLPAAGKRFFLVDPLDGTKEFIRGDDGFTVNIALVEDGEPLLGVVLAPARGSLYAGAKGEGAWRTDLVGGQLSGNRRPISARAAARPPRAVASISHRDEQTNAFLAERGITDVVGIGSSLKFCLVAEGDADIYPRFGPTMEWDTAAGHAVLRAAGGSVTDLENRPFVYGKASAGYKNGGFIARGR